MIMKIQNPWDLGNKACCGVWASCNLRRRDTSVYMDCLFDSDWVLMPMWILFGIV